MGRQRRRTFSLDLALQRETGPEIAQRREDLRGRIEARGGALRDDSRKNPLAALRVDPRPRVRRGLDPAPEGVARSSSPILWSSL